MERSKGFALMFLLGAFLAGGAVGFAAHRVIGAERGREMRGPDAYRHRMARKLDLTPAQQTSIDSLMDQKKRQIVELYRPVKPQLDSLALASRVISDSTNAQIKRLLNPEQQTKFEEMRAAGRNDLAKRRAWDSTLPRRTR